MEKEKMDEESVRSSADGIGVSLFDSSAENHLKAMDSIAHLCGETDCDFDEKEFLQLSSTVTFLREWMHYNYEPRAVRFSNEWVSIPEIKYVSSISLPQFSSATVPKEVLYGDISCVESSKDFVMYVGGSVWGLDWCPRVHEKADARIKCEFLAVAAHPPESCHHKIGAPLTGRGIIQIWCILNICNDKDTMSISEKNLQCKLQTKRAAEGKPRGRPRKKPPDESLLAVEPKRSRGRPRKHPIETAQLKKPKGRPRKKATGEPFNNLDGDGDGQYVQALAVQHPDESAVPLAIEGLPEAMQEISVPRNLDEIKDLENRASSSNSAIKLTVRRKRLKSKGGAEPSSHVPSDNVEDGSHQSCGQDSMVVSNVLDNNSLDVGSHSFSISKDIALPRVVLCLAHNGKVAWDLKWRPLNVNDSGRKQRMGYLAVLLGNGSLEVWEVPMPQAMKAIYSFSGKTETDPRFVKLEPVFRCSKLKCGDAQSIPLAVEWSTSANPDFLLAGCHDGSVALWKFSTSKSPEDTRPLLCFTADTVPIRAVAWAPVESDTESANVIVTAGHGGLKFWDIRDPYHPLWDIHPVPRFIYSLDWLPDPRCVVLSFDDGTMRILSLVKAAYDVPATGKPFSGTKQQGFGVYNCSSFAIWNVHVSRLTGMVAYCSADGTVRQFQLTSKAVEKDSRHRAPHFLCGYLTMEDSTVTVHTPLPDNPITLKKSVNESGETPRCLRSLLTDPAQSSGANSNKPKIPVSDGKLLALNYNDDRGLESEPEDTSTSGTGNKGSKSKSKSKRKAEDNSQALVCLDRVEPAKVQERAKGKGGSGIEAFPPKMVALHRVRWNMNKGSERWLCYGGAAGIIRCQEIILPDAVNKSTTKDDSSVLKKCSLG